MIVRAQIIDLCEKASKTIQFVNDSKGLGELVNKSSDHVLVVCDLSEILADNAETAVLLNLRKSPDIQILGKYPHVASQLREFAISAGVDYVVPNSNFIEKLRELLSGE